MAAPRATQWIALRNLARNGGSHHHQVRNLHMTGPATYASPVLTKEHPVLNLPRDIASLRAECKRRKIDPSGSHQDLLSRLNADELTRSRAFSTMQSKRPTPPTQSETVSSSVSSTTAAPVRHFNTSRAHKAVNDSSTIDFAYFPDVDSEAGDVNVFAQMRVPILPTTMNPSTPITAAMEIEELEPVVMKPQINTMSADAVYLPMAELSDGHAMNVDFGALADRVATNIRRGARSVDAQAGIVKQIWGDMVDDVLVGLAHGQKKLMV